jgi:hypothetical protein
MGSASETERREECEGERPEVSSVDGSCDSESESGHSQSTTSFDVDVAGATAPGSQQEPCDYEEPVKRKQIFRACPSCRKAKARCTDYRPCPRCVRMKVSDACMLDDACQPRTKRRVRKQDNMGMQEAFDADILIPPKAEAAQEHVEPMFMPIPFVGSEIISRGKSLPPAVKGGMSVFPLAALQGRT